MPEPKTTDKAEHQERYEKALAEAGIRDVQPAYRHLLRALKTKDASLYDEAVQRYERQLLPELQEGEADPLESWIRYGSWLANRLAPGRVLAIDRTGRAAPPSQVPAPDEMLVHLPDGQGERAVPLAVPVGQSPAQEATRTLLCG